MGRLLQAVIGLTVMLALACAGGQDGSERESSVRGVPMLGGNPARTGVNPGPGVEDSPELLWRFQTGDAMTSSPAVVAGSVYVGSLDGYVYALDAATGEERWRFDTGGEVFSSPAVVAGMVYVAHGQGDPFAHDEETAGYLHALDSATGEQRWSFNTDKWLHSSPAVADGLVYVGGVEGYVYALDAVTGDERWRFQTDGSVYSSPAVAEGVVYIGDGRGYLYALDAGTGEERWRKGVGVVASSPAVVNGMVYVGSSYTAGFREGDWSDIRQGSYVQALDAATGDYVWRFGTDDINLSAPAVVDGTVYVGGEGFLYALDAATGDGRWRFETVRSAHSSVVVNGVVYVGVGDFETPGHIYAVDAVTGEERWRFETGGEVWSSPAVVDGVLYVGSADGYVYAITEE